MLFYKKIQLLALQRGLSISDLAKELKISRTSLYTYRYKQPSPATLRKIAAYFDLPVSEFLGLEYMKENITDLKKKSLADLSHNKSFLS